jgi:long-subunit fatty acid transport protein
MYTIGKLTLGLSGKVYTKGNAEFHHQHWGTQRYFDTIYTEIKKTTDTSIISREKVSTSKSTGEVKLPPSLAFGVSYQYSPEWLLSTDMDITMWKKYHSERSLQAEDKSDRSSAVNFAVGAQFIPAPNLLTPKYYEIIQYRAGMRISKLPGAQAMESALTLGAGLPFRKGGGIFDLYIEAGRRWDKRYSNYSENFFSIQFGLNGGSKWFQSSDEGY